MSAEQDIPGTESAQCPACSGGFSDWQIGEIGSFDGPSVYVQRRECSRCGLAQLKAANTMQEQK